MRDVLVAVFEKAKHKNISEINKMMNELLPNVSTNIDANEVIRLLPTLMQYNVTDSQGWPYEVKGITLDRWYGVPVTLENSVKKLHETLFNESDYQVSSAVKNINSAIIKKTGYGK
ncbi:hypothetical protein D3C87_1833120 [compost metagenome]